MILEHPVFEEGRQWRKLRRDERAGTKWKYVLLQDVVAFVDTGVKINHHCLDGSYRLWGVIAPTGIVMKAGYAWNGCSCSPDFEIRSSAWHDLLYQFSGCEQFPPKVTRRFADDLFYMLRVTRLGWAFRLGLSAGSWAFWAKEPRAREYVLPQWKI